MMEVVDGNGRVIGTWAGPNLLAMSCWPVLLTNTAPRICQPCGTEILARRVTKDDVIGIPISAEAWPVHFCHTSTDCSGDRYLGASGAPLAILMFPMPPLPVVLRIGFVYGNALY